MSPPSGFIGSSGSPPAGEAMGDDVGEAEGFDVGLDDGDCVWSGTMTTSSLDEACQENSSRSSGFRSKIMLRTMRRAIHGYTNHKLSITHLQLLTLGYLLLVSRSRLHS